MLHNLDGLKILDLDFPSTHFRGSWPNSLFGY